MNSLANKIAKAKQLAIEALECPLDPKERAIIESILQELSDPTPDTFNGLGEELRKQAEEIAQLKEKLTSLNLPGFDDITGILV